MKALISALTLCLASVTYADEDANLSVGWGTDHGGVVGLRYALNRGASKYYGTVSLLGYSSSAGAEAGYGIGWEHLVSRDKHAMGIFAGTVALDFNGDEAAVYHGLAGTYNYYFRGFTERTLVVGGSIYGGTTSGNDRLFEDDKYGINAKLAFQW